MNKINERSDYYLIDGYWINSGEAFDGYIMCNYEYFIPNDNGITDEDVFYYGMSRDVAELNIESDTFDFVIIEVYDLGATYNE